MEWWNLSFIQERLTSRTDEPSAGGQNECDQSNDWEIQTEKESIHLIWMY